MADAVAVLGFDDREFRTGVQGAVQRMGTLGTAATGTAFARRIARA